MPTRAVGEPRRGALGTSSSSWARLAITAMHLQKCREPARRGALASGLHRQAARSALERGDVPHDRSVGDGRFPGEVGDLRFGDALEPASGLGKGVARAKARHLLAELRSLCSTAARR